MTKTRLTKWTLRDTSGNIQVSASVPGDITYDLFQAGKIRDPYVDMNYKDAEEYQRKDYEYISILKIDKVKQDKEYFLVFDGIDTFAEVYLDDVLLGKTENMFLQYRFDISSIVKKAGGPYVLKVRMNSTLNAMDKIDCKDYFATFNTPRIFLRKAQCHFGWDWAPNLPGYGIWQDVYLTEENKQRIENVNYLTNNDGGVIFNVELNYNIRNKTDHYGGIRELGTPFKDDKIRITLGDITETVTVAGMKNIVNLFVKEPKLWYPRGYGEHPLYDYKVELIRDGEVVDVKSGRLAFRTVELLQSPIDKNHVGFSFLINGKKVFVKGSNWVPTECFSGIATDEKYKMLIDRAVDANLNLLRVWGGGLYEKDIFYDLCDENGLMVWQDLMFACSDIPENDDAFVQNTLTEIEYQIKRLRVHPSIIYWCGSNEKTGSYGLCVSHGDFFVNTILQGFVYNLDKTRPIIGQSPVSMTDVGNDVTSGEAHHNSFESSLHNGIENYRELVSKQVVPFISECAIMGPCSVESFEKFFTKDTQWPMNDTWVDRLSDNPYAAILMPFCEREKYYASKMYGEPKNIKEFVTKGMTVHAECMRAEAEFARSHTECSGFLNWMYNDIWPTATWSIVDYYGEPKQAYYQMKKSYRPILATFIRNGEGEYEVSLINNTLSTAKFVVEYGCKKMDGTLVWSKTAQTEVGENGVSRILTGQMEKDTSTDCYLYIKGNANGQEIDEVWSPFMWRGVEFTSDYTVTTKQITDTKAEITVKANKFAKSVFLHFKDNCDYTFSDNYLDIEAEAEKTVTVTADKAFDVTKVMASDFAVKEGV